MVAKWRLLPDLAIFAIPTLNAISVASGGFVYSELKTRGLPGSPYRRGSTGVQPTPPTDAITRMFAAIPALKAWGANYIAKRRYRGQASAYVNLTAIEGGLPFRPSKLAAACRLYVDIGLMPGDDPADAIDGLRNCIAGIERADPDIGIEMNVVKVAEGAEVSTDEPIVAALSDAFRQSCHRDPEITWDGWCTDVGVFNRAGIPAVSYGAHGRTRSAEESFLTVGEHVNVDDLVRGAEVFVRAACTIAREQD